LSETAVKKPPYYIPVKDHVHVSEFELMRARVVEREERLEQLAATCAKLREEIDEARRALDPRDEMTSLSVAEIVALRAI
jgi:uncharacterized protein (DUF342 family)